MKRNKRMKMRVFTLLRQYRQQWMTCRCFEWFGPERSLPHWWDFPPWQDSQEYKRQQILFHSNTEVEINYYLCSSQLMFSSDDEPLKHLLVLQSPGWQGLNHWSCSHYFERRYSDWKQTIKSKSWIIFLKQERFVEIVDYFSQKQENFAYTISSVTGRVLITYLYPTK